ncbi:hypothetical protein LJC49_07720 [Ruminococcaceae bacterium OttesenSCG-928-I18]|nr:hypothetical protein [Ruminococcaceae bacterium OttesenSCG-928-I18]
MEKDPKGPLKPEREILLDQIVEEDNGEMRVLSEEDLLQEAAKGEALLLENELAAENLENDLPCADLMDTPAPEREEQ